MDLCCFVVIEVFSVASGLFFPIEVSNEDFDKLFGVLILYEPEGGVGSLSLMSVLDLRGLIGALLMFLLFDYLHNSSLLCSMEASTRLSISVCS